MKTSDQTNDAQTSGVKAKRALPDSFRRELAQRWSAATQRFLKDLG